MLLTHEQTTACIDVDHVSFGYGDMMVLRDITCHIKSGEYVGIVGPNGAGKTTFLQLILGLVKPTKGSIKIFGHSIEEAREHVEIGYVPQRVAQFDPAFPATVDEIVLSGRTKRRGFFASLTVADRESCDRALLVTGISALRSKRIGELSGGQRQRVWIARALAAEPKILILDEPTVGVDISTIETLYTLLSTLNRENHLTIVMVSHDVDAVAREVTTVLCLNGVLVGHVPSAAFSSREYREGLYGSESKAVTHEH